MRLGLDLGTTSIGWVLYETTGKGSDAQITKIMDAGVRIFSDGREPKSGASLAVNRRVARAQRRRRDRYLRRRASLMRVLAQAGLMPADPVAAQKLTLLDPYELRATGLDTALPLTHLGRALFHLNQRRGFKSNRKTDRGDNESGLIKDAAARLDLEMDLAGAKTYGQFLHMRRQKSTDQRQVPPVRTRLSVAVRGASDKAESGYDFYPERRHLEAEFHALWDAQATHHDILTDDLKDLVFEKIFYQRPLKAPEIGLCLFTGEKRAAKAHPLTQRRVLYETVNQLRVTADGKSSRPLTLDDRNAIIHALDNKKPTKSLSSMKLTLSALAKVVTLKPGERFTLEAAARDAIACDSVRAAMIHPDVFGPRWSTLDMNTQWDIISRIRAVQSDAEYRDLVSRLIAEHELDQDTAERVANAPLPEGYGRLSVTASQNLLAHLKAEVIPYAEAIRRCGWHHSNQRSGEALDALPYYGEVLDRHVIPGTGEAQDDPITRFGRITNPTVHIGLNQLRRVVNKIIDRYGKPDEIVVELARDLKQSDAQRAASEKSIKDNTNAATKRGEKLDDIGIENNGANRMLLRLWETLGDDAMKRACPYTGQRISIEMLFNGSCDIDHILPYSRTLDDSFANRTLCLREANREKSNKTPWERWGDTDRWDAIEANLKHLPESKRWRFGPDAMVKFEDQDDFLDRSLKDTQYLSRIARTYLDTLFDKGGHVWVVPGRLTEMLRRHWGLNSLLSDKDGAMKHKNRTDHRHHAIDAAVIAATDRSLVNRLSKAAGQKETEGAEMVARDSQPPWESFRADLHTILSRITVSHRADHGRIAKDSTTGQLHNDTAYGIIDGQTVVSRTPLLSLKPGDIEITTKGKNIRDPQLQSLLANVTKGKDGKDFETALARFSQTDGPYKGIRSVRLVETLGESARVEIRQPDTKPFKAYKGDSNHRYELWKLPDGKIVPLVVTTYQANTGDVARPHPAAKRLLQIHKRDMVRLERDGKTLTCYVQSMHVKNGLFLVPHNETNADARNRNKDDPFRFIQIGAGPILKSGLRRVHVDEIGYVRDPGPPKS